MMRSGKALKRIGSSARAPRPTAPSSGVLRGLQQLRHPDFPTPDSTSRVCLCRRTAPLHDHADSPIAVHRRNRLCSTYISFELTTASSLPAPVNGAGQSLAIVSLECCGASAH